MKRLFRQAVVLLLFLGPGSALANIVDVSITPPTPFADSTFTVQVNGYFSDGCWGATQGPVEVDGSEIRVNIQGLDGWRPGLYCTLALVNYSFTYTLGPLPAGGYTLRVIENHVSQRDPIPGQSTHSFTILPRPRGCVGWVGNIDCDGNETSDIADLTFLIDHLFINFTPLGCPGEANIDGDPFGIVDITDLTYLIDLTYIHITGPPACPDFVIYDYIAFDESMRPAIIGSFSYTTLEDSSLTGAWRFRALRDSIGFGPQIGTGSLEGETFNGQLSINLQPGWVDDNIYLDGNPTQQGWFGKWRHSTLLGTVLEGHFEAHRRY